jgi:hypothetical protein
VVYTAAIYQADLLDRADVGLERERLTAGHLDLVDGLGRPSSVPPNS